MLLTFIVSQLAGVVAVEVTGGPTIDFVAGRKVSILQCHNNFLGLILFRYKEVICLLINKMDAGNSQKKLCHMKDCQ